MPYFDCFYLSMSIHFTMSSLLVIMPAQKTGALYLENMSSFLFSFCNQASSIILQCIRVFCFLSLSDRCGMSNSLPIFSATRVRKTVRDKYCNEGIDWRSQRPQSTDISTTNATFSFVYFWPYVQKMGCRILGDPQVNKHRNKAKECEGVPLAHSYLGSHHTIPTTVRWPTLHIIHIRNESLFI